jgi:hypothetical protein
MTTQSVFSSSKWSVKKSKLAVCIPTRDTLHSAHAMCLLELVKFNTMHNIDTHVFMNASTVLLTQRERLATSAIELDSEYVLWLDSDMTFPATTAVRLLAHNEPVVAANYVTRSMPLKGVAYTSNGDWSSWLSFEKTESLAEVERVGMGCFLMKTELFSKLSKPWFEFKWNPESNDYSGEDFILCQKLLDAGYKIKVDTALSHDIRHLGTYGFGPGDLA